MKILKYIYIAIAICIFVSCEDEAQDAVYSAQERYIENFIKSELEKHPEYNAVSNNGSERLILKEGEGDGLNKNGEVYFYYAVFQLSSRGANKETLISTNKKDIAKEMKWEISDSLNVFKPLALNLRTDKVLNGLKNGLHGVKKGEECYIMFSTKYAFGDKIMGSLPANSGLFYHIWIENIKND